MNLSTALVLGGLIIFVIWAIKTSGPQEPTETLATEKPSDLRYLRWLPVAFYVIACLGFMAFLILAVQAKSGYVFGYGIGAMLSCFATGRVIELLQIIADELQQKRMSE